jgi:4-hydroxy-3-methylbut-2-enyl diphosphate reductase
VARVGVTAGASAPDSLVRAVIDRLRAAGGTVRELPGPAETMVFALPRGLRGISAA